MNFASPELLALLLLVPVSLAAYVVLQRRRERYVVRFTNVALLENLVPRRPAWRRHVPTALYLAAIALLAVALARPSMAMPVPREEATIVLAMDTSRSMIATDVTPDRLTAAKRAAETFIAQLPAKFRVGLVAFSTDARLVLAPTTDRAQLQAALEGLQANGGTALGDAIALSVDAAGRTAGTTGRPAVAAASPDPSPSASPSGTPGAAAEPPLAATVLLTDGANSTGQLEPLQAASISAAAGMPVYTIGLGTSDGTVQVQDNQGVMHTMSVPPDLQTLQDVSAATGGRSFSAPTSQDLASIYQSLGSKVGYTTEEQEVTSWFAAGALLLVLAGAGMAAFWFNRIP